VSTIQLLSARKKYKRKSPHSKKKRNGINSNYRYTYQFSNLFYLSSLKYYFLWFKRISRILWHWWVLTFFKISRWTVDSVVLSMAFCYPKNHTNFGWKILYCQKVSTFLFFVFLLRFLGFLTWNTSLRYNGCLPHFRETAMTTYWLLKPILLPMLAILYLSSYQELKMTVMRFLNCDPPVLYWLITSVQDFWICEHKFSGMEKESFQVCNMVCKT
jgi:hypothetical protein